MPERAVEDSPGGFCPDGQAESADPVVAAASATGAVPRAGHRPGVGTSIVGVGAFVAAATTVASLVGSISELVSLELWTLLTAGGIAGMIAGVGVALRVFPRGPRAVLAVLATVGLALAGAAVAVGVQMWVSHNDARPASSPRGSDGPSSVASAPTNPTLAASGSTGPALTAPGSSPAANSGASRAAPSRTAAVPAATDWVAEYPSNYNLNDRWGADFDSSDPTFDGWIATEGNRPETADVRYVGSIAAIDNNNNLKVTLKTVNGPPSLAGCLDPAGYTRSVNIRSYPNVCIRTTAGNIVHFRASAYSATYVKFSDLVIWKHP